MLRKVIHKVDSVTGRNMNFIQKKVGLEFYLSKVRLGWFKGKLTIENDIVWSVNLIKDITNLYHNLLHLNEDDNFLPKEQLREVMHYVSSS